MSYRFLLSVAFGVLICSCQWRVHAADPPEQEAVASGPMRAPLAHFAPEAELGWSPEHPMAAVGAMLFFDPRLSPTSDESCGSCHQPHRGFSSSRTVAGRSTPGLLNLAFTEPYIERARLVQRLSGIVERHAGWQQSIEAVVERLRGDSTYDALLARVIPRGLHEESLIFALTEFVARLVSSGSHLDDFLRGEGGALSAEALHGLQLFRGRAGCIDCHNGPFLSDGRAHRVCLSGELTDEPRPTPSLRDISRTAPYLRDGTLATLEDVIRVHGNTCGTARSNLSADEVSAMLAFLGSLDGATVSYYPIRIPGRHDALPDLQEEMDRIDALMKKNLSAIQAAVEGLSRPDISPEDWARVARAALLIHKIARRLPHLFPPRHLHDLSAYHAFTDELARSAEALAQAARQRRFNDAFVALGALNQTCNQCHELYRPPLEGEEAFGWPLLPMDDIRSP